jgi:[acyl-carrier-protein] S-malonyltransferase
MTNFTFAFPGQGSQSVAMLAGLAEQFPVVIDTYKEASDALGYDLWALVQQGPSEDLNQTDKTQPALLAASVAVWRVWAEQGGALPSVIAGHSLGEYSALVCAGVIEFKDAIKLVELRGQLMQQAVPAGVGAMYAIIGLADDKIAQACEQAAQGEVVSPVNYNSPGQVVIAGNKDAVERAGVLCKEAGAKRALPLPVSVPSHCALMKPAAEKLAIALQGIDFRAPQISVINNVDVIAETDVNKIKDALVRQLYCPVRWTSIIEKMASQGINLQVEAGPGKVLSGLVRRIDKSFTAQVINDVATLESALAAVKGE